MLEVHRCTVTKEDSKRVHKFHGKSGGDFHLWKAQTETAPRAKAVFDVVEEEIVSIATGTLSEELQQKVGEACEVIIRGLRDNPSRVTGLDDC